MSESRSHTPRSIGEFEREHVADSSPSRPECHVLETLLRVRGAARNTSSIVDRFPGTDGRLCLQLAGSRKSARHLDAFASNTGRLRAPSPQLDAIVGQVVRLRTLPRAAGQARKNRCAMPHCAGGAQRGFALRVSSSGQPERVEGGGSARIRTPERDGRPELSSKRALVCVCVCVTPRACCVFGMCLVRL